MTPRTAKEALIIDIVEATTEKDKEALARQIAIAANIQKWTLTDLHALYQKRHEVKNFTSFVRWSAKTKNKV